MTRQTTSIHAEAGLHRKLVLFAVQLEGYLVHFPNCHKYTLTQGIRQAFVDVYNLVTESSAVPTSSAFAPGQAPGLCVHTSYQPCAQMPAVGGCRAWCPAWAMPGAPHRFSHS